MEETALHWNNLSLLFLHLGASSSGGVMGKMARSSLRPSDLTRFMSGGRRSALSRATVVSAAVVVLDVLQLGTWLMAGKDAPLLRLRQIKLAALRSGDHGEDPRPTCHKVSVSLLATAWFIGSKSVLVCNGALPDLGMVVVHLFSGVAMVTAEDDGGRCFGKAWDSPRVEL
jgi:hypothetical protein